ncbi:hypothetical protein ACSBR1_007899 [Camellia fascicularis]
MKESRHQRPLSESLASLSIAITSKRSSSESLASLSGCDQQTKQTELLPLPLTGALAPFLPTTQFQVLLVDQSERFVFKPMLYELLSGEVDIWEIAPCFSDLLANTSVLFFQDRVKLLHPLDHEGMYAPTRSSCGGTVHLESGLLIEYDWLVLALGAESKVDVVPGAAEFALPFSTLEDACVDLLRGQKSDKVDVTLQPEEWEVMNNVLHAKYEEARRRRSCVVKWRISVTWLSRSFSYF